MATSLKKKLLILPPLLMGLAFLVFMVGNKKGPEQAAPEEPVHKVRVLDIAPIAVVPRVLGYGSVTPEKVWTGTAEVAGQVIYVHPDFKSGAMLRAGVELVRIAPTDYTLAIAQIEANLRSTDAQLVELGVTKKNTQASLKIEQFSLDIREQELERKRKLFKRGTVSQSAVDTEQRSVLSQNLQVQNLRNTLNLIPTQRRVLEEQVAVYNAQLADAQLDLERTSIRLPFDARIAEANVEITQFAQIGQQLAIADSIKTSEVVAQFPIALFRDVLRSASNSDTPRLTTTTIRAMFAQMGMTAEIRLRTGRDQVRWEGRIVRVFDTIDPQTRTVGIVVAVDDTYTTAVPGIRPPLVKGMYVEVELSASPQPDKLVVPRSAIRSDTLFVVGPENRLQSRKVKTGLLLGDFIVVEQGLEAGEQVVITDLIPALDGMKLATQIDTVLSNRLAIEVGVEGSVR